MNFVLKPWQLLLLILAGWINRHQQDAIEYLLTENQVLGEKLGKRRILLTDLQHRRFAVQAPRFWVGPRFAASLFHKSKDRTYFTPVRVF